MSFTNDDLQRNAQYAANKIRKALETSSQSFDDYLRSLGMAMVAEPFVDVDIPRVSQLINKTNQFNTTTLRKTLDEVKAFADDPNNLTLQVRLTDKFGDNGLISALMLMPVENQSDTFEIETWVMSCRVFGRQLEHEILNALASLARKSSVRSLVARYRPTAKNSLVRTLYSDIGFESLPATSSDPPDESRWSLDLSEFTEHETHISTSTKNKGGFRKSGRAKSELK